MTLDQLRARCTIDADGCWIWQRATIGNMPATFDKTKRRSLSARRVAYELANNVTLRTNQVAVNECGEPLCINPACTVARTKVAFMRREKLAGRLRRDAAAIARMTLVNRRKGKLDIDKARVIRARLADGEVGAGLAKEYSVSRGTIYLIDHNRIWREPRSGLALIAAQAGML